MAIDELGSAIAQGGGAFAADDDPELVRAAAPFSLKLIESLLAERPQHRGLLLAAARGFTQYAYAFLQQEAEELEDQSVADAGLLEARARRLYRRARDYGVGGLSVQRRDFASELRVAPRRAVSVCRRRMSHCCTGQPRPGPALIALSKDEPDVLGELPVVEALIDRALELDESFERGAIHSFLIGYESVRQAHGRRPGRRARAHFARAMELSGGADAAPLVALAESVCVPQQRRAEFEALLERALRIDTDRATEKPSRQPRGAAPRALAAVAQRASLHRLKWRHHEIYVRITRRDGLGSLLAGAGCPRRRRRGRR